MGFSSPREAFGKFTTVAGKLLVKGPDSKYLGFSMLGVFVTSMQLCCHSLQTAKDNAHT